MLRAILAEPTPLWPRRDDSFGQEIVMGQLRTANKRHNRAIAVAQARKAALAVPPLPAAPAGAVS